MIDQYQDFAKSLEKGFINQLAESNTEYLPQLLVNDAKNGKKVLSVIDQKLKTCAEFWFSTAFITTGGVAILLNTLRELESRGVKGKILASQYQNFTQPEALRKLLKFKNIELKIATDGNFHAKGYLFRTDDIYDIIIGSSNFTATALSVNKEMNLKISATKSSYIIHNTLREFSTEFEVAQSVTEQFISEYAKVFRKRQKITRLLETEIELNSDIQIAPNAMQERALNNLKLLRDNLKNRALLISATGTGKTYLSAFDAKAVKPAKLLFIVHRHSIAEAAMKTFKKVFGDTRSLGLYSGVEKNFNKDFVFCTIQTISKEQNLNQFDTTHFDYIVIDETHRAQANSYKRIIDHFKPKFLLGMTATPERTDGLDVFSLFDHNIAYEIRLHQALEEQMLCPFHYYGVTDLSIDGVEITDKTKFNTLVSEQRLQHIIEKIKFYGTDSGITRGLVFCSCVAECESLAISFRKYGYSTTYLTGASSPQERSAAIHNLESNGTERIDYIFTYDVFNEGVDIPSVNQIVMLRPTQSAIVFVQQMGRGLRTFRDKTYLTIIDFIGNYTNNFLVPIALYGDTSYSKDTLRKFIASGSNFIPGTSTVHFDKIALERIYTAINFAKLDRKKDLDNDYLLLKYKLGRSPMMMDFLEHGARDPYQFVDYSRSYFNFTRSVEANTEESLPRLQNKYLELFSTEINNSKRVEESIILRELLKNNLIKISHLKRIIKDEFGYITTDETVDSAIWNLNFNFYTESHNKKIISASSKYGLSVVDCNEGTIRFTAQFAAALSDNLFKVYLLDNTLYAIKKFSELFEPEKYIAGFVLYRKYSRKDVLRILNWKQNQVAQNVGGYKLSDDGTNLPIFVNYDKKEDISDSTKYHDRFVNRIEFDWMSKSNRTLNSKDILAIRNVTNRPRLPLFINKSTDEGKEFYFMGDVIPFDNGLTQTTIKDGDGKDLPIVKVRFKLEHLVDENIYNYITSTSSRNK